MASASRKTLATIKKMKPKNNKTIENYIENASPMNWFDYARELKEASEELWNSHSNTLIGFQENENTYYKKNFSRTYFILMGLAIENLMKGILISENPDYIKNGKINSEISSGHNLEFLSKKIETLSFIEKEKEIFKILSMVIPYWGKYPIPKNFNQLESEIFMTEKWFYDLIELYSKLEFKLCELNINGIKGPNGIEFPKLYVEGITEK